MKSVKVLGSGCTKCKQLYDNVKKVSEDNGIEIKLEKVEDFTEMMKYNILATPALVVDEDLKFSGKVCSVDELKTILQ